MIKTSKLVLALGIASLVLTGCASGNSDGRKGMFSKSSEGQALGVNRFLWSASLETINFMPLAEADPYGGVIITDWYSNPAAANERLKATIYILDSRLRADGLKVSIFRETKDKSGQWVGAKVDPNTAIQIESAILTRARKLKVSSLR